MVTAHNHGVGVAVTFTSAGTAGSRVLQGDAVASSIAGQVRSVLGTAVQALSGTFTSLAQIGVTLQKDGGLALDSAKLKDAMNGAFGDIAGLFAMNPEKSRITVGPYFAHLAEASRDEAGTSMATATPCFVIVIASPLATSSRRRGRWVFAS